MKICKLVATIASLYLMHLFVHADSTQNTRDIKHHLKDNGQANEVFNLRMDIEQLKESTTAISNDLPIAVSKGPSNLFLTMSLILLILRISKL